MKSYFCSPSYQLGLDIQADKIRLVLLRKSGQTFFLERIDEIALPDDMLVKKKMRYWEEATTALSDYTKRFKLKGTPTAINLPANTVMMQHIDAPIDLSHEAIETEIREKVQRDLRGVADALCIDYKIIQHLSNTKLFFAVANQAVVSHYVDCLNEVELNLKIIDVDIFSLNRAIWFALQWYEDPKKNYAIICVNEEMAAFTVFTAQEMLCYQTWSANCLSDFLVQFKNNIQSTIRAALIQHLAVYAKPAYYHLISQDDFFNAYLLEHMDPTSSSLQLTHRISKTRHFIPSDFFIACGAALREFPIW